jgi:hypothetical protein
VLLKQISRLRFHIRNYTTARKRRKETAHESSDITREEAIQIAKRILAEGGLEDFDDLLPDDDPMTDIDDLFLDNELPRLEFDPDTAIVFTGEHGKRCNFLTAWYYRRRIRRIAEESFSKGVNTFFADYMDPFGLLALETLCEMKKDGENFALYALQSGSIAERKSYRLIPETNVELIFLGAYFDGQPFSPYHGDDVLLDAYATSKYLCTETGVVVNQDRDTL